MIGKCKAIAHGSTALDYIFREGKLGSRLTFHSRGQSTALRKMARCFNLRNVFNKLLHKI